LEDGKQDGLAPVFVGDDEAEQDSGVDQFRDVPVQVRPRGDDVAVHGPVVVFAEGDPPSPLGYGATIGLGGVAVAGFGILNRQDAKARRLLEGTNRRGTEGAEVIVGARVLVSEEFEPRSCKGRERTQRERV
jgi:hypothetical protein